MTTIQDACNEALSLAGEYGMGRAIWIAANDYNYSMKDVSQALRERKAAKKQRLESWEYRHSLDSGSDASQFRRVCMKMGGVLSRKNIEV